MIYSTVISNNWHKILPYKEKYTKKDMDKIMEYSLFNMDKTFSSMEARFIVICTAIFHNTDYSKYIRQYNQVQNMIA